MALAYPPLVRFFFFQAEDGIRDRTVTGVQTCALPIWLTSSTPRARSRIATNGSDSLSPLDDRSGEHVARCALIARSANRAGERTLTGFRAEIGRASCRERVEMSVVAVGVKIKRCEVQE